MRIVAAVDNSAVARSVLEVARMLSQVRGDTLEAVHVRMDGSSTAEGLARSFDVPLRLLDGDPVTAVLGAFGEPGVGLGVIGARGHRGGRRPIGHATIDVAERATVPLVVVPIDACECIGERMARVLVPLEGTEEGSAAVREAVHVLAGAGAEIVALHVRNSAHTPRFSDRPEHEHDAWNREFLSRHCWEPGTRLEVRTGAPAEQILRVAAAERVDLIALAWSLDLSSGRAQTVRDVLARAAVPVLLVPMRAPAIVSGKEHRR